MFHPILIFGEDFEQNASELFQMKIDDPNVQLLIFPSYAIKCSMKFNKPWIGQQVKQFLSKITLSLKSLGFVTIIISGNNGAEEFEQHYKYWNEGSKGFQIIGPKRPDSSYSWKKDLKEIDEMPEVIV